MTFPCSYGFAAFWTVACMLGGFAIACICRAAGSAEDCLNCDTWRRRWLQARRHLREANRGAERNAMALELATRRYRSFVANGPYSTTSQNITPPGCGLPEEAVSAPQRAGIILEGKLKGAILDPSYPAPSPGTGPDAGTGSANSTPGLGKGGVTIEREELKAKLSLTQARLALSISTNALLIKKLEAAAKLRARKAK